MKRDFKRLLQKIPVGLAPYFIMFFLMAVTLFGAMLGHAILSSLIYGN